MPIAMVTLSTMHRYSDDHRGHFHFFQNFKLFFHKKIDFHLFVANYRGDFEPYVVVILGKHRSFYEAMVTGIQSNHNVILIHSMGWITESDCPFLRERF